MAMYGSDLKISIERLKELQSQPEAVEEFLSGVRLRLKEQYFGLNRFFYDLHFYLGQLPVLDSLWREWGVSSSDGVIGKEIENVSYGVGSVRFVTPNEVQEIANALRSASQEEFMNAFRENHPTWQEDDYDWVLSIYLEWIEFWQIAAQEGQAVLFWMT
jgi:hypothetical protein